jgi:hypothetical protein
VLVEKMKELFHKGQGQAEALVGTKGQGQAEALVGTVVHQLKATRFFQMGDVKSDPFSISWEDEDDAVDTFCLFIKKEIYPILGPLFKIGKFASFKVEDILDVFIYGYSWCYQ